MQNIQIDAIRSIRFNLNWYFKIRFGSNWIINIIIWIWTENIKTKFYSIWFKFILNPNQKPNFHSGTANKTMGLLPLLVLIIRRIILKITTNNNIIINGEYVQRISLIIGFWIRKPIIKGIQLITSIPIQIVTPHNMHDGFEPDPAWYCHDFCV